MTASRRDLEVTVGTTTYEIHLLHKGFDQNPSKTRVYVSGVAAPIAEPIWDDFPQHHGELNEGRAEKGMKDFGPGSVLYTTKGEFADVDKAWDRTNKSQIAVWAYHAERVMNHLVWKSDDAKVYAGAGQMRFSKKAGCSMCPCSPGFVHDTQVYDNQKGYAISDIFITVKK